MMTDTQSDRNRPDQEFIDYPVDCARMPIYKYMPISTGIAATFPNPTSLSLVNARPKALLNGNGSCAVMSLAHARRVPANKMLRLPLQTKNDAVTSVTSLCNRGGQPAAAFTDFRGIAIKGCYTVHASASHKVFADPGLCSAAPGSLCLIIP